MATGDYFNVSNKAITGFDVAFFNSSNAGVSSYLVFKTFSLLFRDRFDSVAIF